jgi:hypothetical protein
VSHFTFPHLTAEESRRPLSRNQVASLSIFASTDLWCNDIAGDLTALYPIFPIPYSFGFRPAYQIRGNWREHNLTKGEKEELLQSPLPLSIWSIYHPLPITESVFALLRTRQKFILSQPFLLRSASSDIPRISDSIYSSSCLIWVFLWLWSNFDHLLQANPPENHKVQASLAILLTTLFPFLKHHISKPAHTSSPPHPHLLQISTPTPPPDLLLAFLFSLFASPGKLGKSTPKIVVYISHSFLPRFKYSSTRKLKGRTHTQSFLLNLLRRYPYFTSSVAQFFVPLR